MTGGSRDSLPQKVFEKFPFPLPPLNIQKKIVNKLDTVLKKIDDKKKLVVKLQEENIIYGQKLSSEIFYGLIWKMIHQFVDDKFKILNEFVEEQKTIDPRKNEDKNFQYVEIGGIDTVNKKIKHWKSISGRNPPSRARKMIQENDVIFATTRPYYRNIAIIPKELDNQICTTGFCVLKSKNYDDLEPQFLFYFLQTDFALKQILKNMHGGAYPAVSDKDVLGIKIPVISHSNQISIIKKINSMEKSLNSINSKVIETNTFQEDGLIYIKNIESSILNAAFSGKLIHTY